jgi:hypothetical protein
VQDFGARRCFSQMSLIPLKNHFKTRRSRRNFPLQADPPHPFSFVRLAVNRDSGRHNGGYELYCKKWADKMFETIIAGCSSYRGGDCG